MLKIKVQSMKNGVHRSKKQETEAKSKTGNVKETYQYNVCAPPNTATQNRAQI